MIINKLAKIIFAGLILVTACLGNIFAQIDSEAVAILDSMSNVVTSLESCTFTLKTEYDVYSTRLGLIKMSDEANVFLKAPDKLLVNKKGDKGWKDFYYDGYTFSYYSADNNQYASVPAPPTIMETIDSLHNYFGIDFPAADFFYPDLVDTMIANATNLSYMGLTTVEGKECFHIAGTNDEFTYQMWIASDEMRLPVKLVIVYVNQPGSPQYEATFRNWFLNPSLDDEMFNFDIPKGANRIFFKK